MEQVKRQTVNGLIAVTAERMKLLTSYHKMTEQLSNQLQASLKFIENPENYFSMFKYVISSCTTAEFANKILFAAEALSDSDFSENSRRISEAKQNAIKIHGEWAVRTLEQSKTRHTVRTLVSTLYSDIFNVELK